MSVEANLLTPLSLATDTYPLRNSFRKIEGVNYNPDISYHTAAILASTLVKKNLISLEYTIENFITDRI